MTKVAVTCSTYRNPENDPFIRTYGVVSLINQMLNQNFDGEVCISLIDDSPTPHVFAQKVSDALPDQVSYVHVTDRHQLRGILEQEAPERAMLVPTDSDLQRASILLLRQMVEQRLPVTTGDLKLAQGNFDLNEAEWDALLGWTKPEIVSPERAAHFLGTQNIDALQADENANFWMQRLGEVRSYGSLVPFEEDYPIQTNTYKQVFEERPTIGMKKNAGNAIAAACFGKPDVLVYADDDDQHGPDYVSRVVNALGQNDFTRMTRYFTYIFNADPGAAQPGVFNLPIIKQQNNYWALTHEGKEQTRYMWLPEEGRFNDTTTIGEKFSRPVSLAWPILSHEGALHTYRYATWEESLSGIGGAFPASFCEDIIGYRALKDSLGDRFRDVLTPVEPGEESFIRIADGNNASVIEVTGHIEVSEMPDWARDSLNFLHAAYIDPDCCTDETLGYLAGQFAHNGILSVHDVAGRPDRTASLSM